ncbi:hypothetical protein QUF58_07235 [Anaerolineales bacterium HSG24]|nr:hypothetical protein [Anaerolineales bacterium HSG24]
MNNFKLIEYRLWGHSTLDGDGDIKFGSEICTNDHYAYTFYVEEYNLSYSPNIRPNDYWQDYIVSAVRHDVGEVKILTFDLRLDVDLYIFCDPIRFQRIGVIRAGQTALELLPQHTTGGHAWGYSGGGVFNTCNAIWGDISGNHTMERNFPDSVVDLFGTEGLLPQNGHFAIPADVIRSFAETNHTGPFEIEL